MASRSFSALAVMAAAVSVTLAAGQAQTNRDKATAASQRAADRIRTLQREAGRWQLRKAPSWCSCASSKSSAS
jgi:hypothetical protein